MNIFALSTNPGKSSISIIRLSGPNAFYIANKFLDKEPEIRKATRKKIIYNNDLIDIGVVIFYPFNHSYTGEQLVEFNLHGSNAVIKKMLEILCKQKNSRIAYPGEFTQRAFENNKLDLSQVEGIYNLIEAETESQRKLSLKILEGSLGIKVKKWKTQLINILSLLEASIDFSEEELPKDILKEIQNNIYKIKLDFQKELKGSKVADSINNFFEVAIVGKPNVGKSTLLNYLSQKNTSIVTNVPGTTRDIIEVKLDIKGLPVVFLDTAGLHKSNDKVEKIGIKRTLERLSKVDLRIFLINNNKELKTFEKLIKNHDLVFFAKNDLKNKRNKGISGKTGEGTDLLFDQVFNLFSKKTSSVGSVVNNRHRLIIKNSLFFIDDALSKCNSSFDKVEMIAEDIRHTINELNFLTGKVGVEDILSNIFSKFCIGK